MTSRNSNSLRLLFDSNEPPLDNRQITPMRKTRHISPVYFPVLNKNFSQNFKSSQTAINTNNTPNTPVNNQSSSRDSDYAKATDKLNMDSYRSSKMLQNEHNNLSSRYSSIFTVLIFLLINNYASKFWEFFFS